jgi:SRSO17 transposase
MTPKQIASLGNELARFLTRFAGRFRSRAGFALLQIYVQGLLSNLQRKNVEAIALEFGKPPRTLQRFVESIKWDGAGVRDDCQQLVAREHAHPQAIGCLDESGTAKSGDQTVGAARQWLGSRGKVDNGVVGVHLSYSAPGFPCLLDSEVYLTQEWVDDPARRKKTTFPTRLCSAPSRRSPWRWSSERWTTACASRPGRSTRGMDATRPFWMVLNSVGRSSWGRCRQTSAAG